MNSLTVLARDVFTSVMPEVDPDADLYAGDYFDDIRMDAALCNAVRADPLTVDVSEFRSIRLKRLFRRLKARNFYGQLTDLERDQFLLYCSENFASAANSPWLTKSIFDREMKEVLADVSLSERQKECLTVLGNYAEEVAPSSGKMETEL
jgi:exonuclease I